MPSTTSAMGAHESTIRRPRPDSVFPLPWAFLADYRLAPGAPAPSDGRPVFHGEWPSLPALFEITCHRHPDRSCFTVYDPERVSLSYREVRSRVRSLAAYLASIGVAPGDRVALSGKNSPEWAIGYLAILFADAVVVPIDQVLSQDELLNLIGASGARTLLADADKLAALDSVPAVAGVARVSLEPGRPDFMADIIAGVGAEAAAAVAPRRVGGDLAAILYTSGTTGIPKGVMLSHANLSSDALLSQYHLPIYHTDVFYALLPVHHSYTMLAVFIETIAVGAEVVFGKRLIISQVLKDLKQAHVTMFLGVPMLFNRLLAGILKGVRDKGPAVYGLIRAMMWISGRIKKWTGKNPGKKMFHSLLEKASLESIRICISGGGPLPASTFSHYNQLGIDFVQGYGLTETSPIITLNPVWHYKVKSVGALVPGVSIRIDQPGEGGVGEIQVKGPMVMQGYYQNPEATAEVFTADGWLRTGDLGYLDGEDYLYLTGRAKNMIVTEGGKNVYPEEIEDCFQLFPEVDQVLVRGYLADQRNQAEGIEVLLYANQDSFKEKEGGINFEKITERLNEIVKMVNQKLHAHQKISRVTILRQAMEMTSTKKIRRFKVDKDNDRQGTA
jgi:long-chain acyl-CoA synthetase